MFIAGSVSGYFFATINQKWIRAALFVSGVLIALPGLVTDVIGYVVGFAITAVMLVARKLNAKSKAVA